MFIESVRALRQAQPESIDMSAPEASQPRLSTIFSKLPLQMNFPKSHIKTSAVFPFTIGFLVGILAAMLGVGGGFIMVPAMIYIIGMPTITAIGTDLFQIVFTSANVTLQQAITNQTVDIGLALTLLMGSVLGAQVGVRASKYLRGEQIRILLSVIVLVMMVKLLLDLVLTPDNLVSFAKGVSGGH